MRRGIAAAVLAVGLCCANAAGAQDVWTLEDRASSVGMTLAMQGGEVEMAFPAVTGDVGPDGGLTLSVPVDALRTGDALADARLQALLFESFATPVATVLLTLEPTATEGLDPGAQRALTVPFEMRFGAASHRGEADIVLFAASAQIFAVSSARPVRLPLAALGLDAGAARLARVSGGDAPADIALSFDLALRRSAAAPKAPAAVDPVLKACARQIGTIAQSDQIYFASGSSTLEAKSHALLDAIADTLRDCPGISLRIEGHTDNVGQAGYNKALSIDRAGEVLTYLALRDISPERLRATGFGEDRPIATNDTWRGRWKNRRIDFVVLSRDGASRIGWKD